MTPVEMAEMILTGAAEALATGRSVYLERLNVFLTPDMQLLEWLANGELEGWTDAPVVHIPDGPAGRVVYWCDKPWATA